jgi:hypothetical protein
METAWELRPGTDEAPVSGSHLNRFTASPAKQPQQAKVAEKTSETEKNGVNGS